MKPRDQFDLDALLGRWPAQDPQAKGGPSWEERADTIVKAALARESGGKSGENGDGSAEMVEALLAPPKLDAEPGEEKAESYQFDDGATDRPGLQSDVRAAGGDDLVIRPKPQTSGGEAQPMSNDQSSQPKRPSLKDLAARASQAGAGRASVTPLPPAVRSSAPPPAAPATVTPISKAKSARASDPGGEDSGVLRLADLQANQANEAAKAEAAALEAEAALASAAAKRVEDRKVAAAATVAKPAAAEAKSSTGMWAGVAVAVIGIAAAFAVYKTRQPEVAPPKTTQAEVKTESAPVASAAPKPATTGEIAVAATAEPAPAGSDAPKADDAKSAAGTAAATAVASNEPVKAAQPTGSALVGSKVGTLDEEMKKAVGASDAPAPQDDGSKPASGGAAGNVPEQPSQGNAQSAIRAVMGGAKACVAGAPEPSSANVTFSSSGSVQSVSVSGWAAANGKAGCVKGALQGARVSPFAKPSFTVPVTIRP